jgi:hypothetical protein
MAADAFWLQRYTIPKLDISSQLPGSGTPYALVAPSN